jgi:hypothetical protein
MSMRAHVGSSLAHGPEGANRAGLEEGSAWLVPAPPAHDQYFRPLRVAEQQQMASECDHPGVRQRPHPGRMEWDRAGTRDSGAVTPVATTLADRPGVLGSWRALRPGPSR